MNSSQQQPFMFRAGYDRQSFLEADQPKPQTIEVPLSQNDKPLGTPWPQNVPSIESTETTLNSSTTMLRVKITRECDDRPFEINLQLKEANGSVK
ncbi:Hypothetical protein D9617_46g064360 [Elsinoe fawcettii]|nr:Hypothetical protein D9617_46g064360 [Elsinoe fawcettii]